MNAPLVKFFWREDIIGGTAGKCTVGMIDSDLFLYTKTGSTVQSQYTNLA